jgi:hypothetical protein
MLKLLERSITAIEHRLVLLATPKSAILPHFRDVQVDPERRQRLIREMQQFRGSIYLGDGAIDRRDLSADGRHQTPEDEKSWHLLMLDPSGRVSSCVWYMEHPSNVAFEQLRVRRSPLATHTGWSAVLWKAVESELARARQHGLRYAEVGGWAVAPDSRCTSEGLLLALAAYSLGRLGAGTLGMTTATVRHASATILRRLGGAPLEADGTPVPAYYDPRYRCQMELLRFDSRQPGAKYSGLIDLLREKLADVKVLAPTLLPAMATDLTRREEFMPGRRSAAA